MAPTIPEASRDHSRECVLCGWLEWEHLLRPEHCAGWIGDR